MLGAGAEFGQHLAKVITANIRLNLAQAIPTNDVYALVFIAAKSRSQKFEKEWIAIAVRQIRQRQAPHTGGKIVYFLSFKNAEQLQRKVDQSQGRVAFGRGEAVNAAVVIAHQTHLPVAVQVVC